MLSDPRGHRDFGADHFSSHDESARVRRREPLGPRVGLMPSGQSA